MSHIVAAFRSAVAPLAAALSRHAGHAASALLQWQLRIAAQTAAIVGAEIGPALLVGLVAALCLLAVAAAVTRCSRSASRRRSSDAASAPEADAALQSPPKLQPRRTAKPLATPAALGRVVARTLSFPSAASPLPTSPAKPPRYFREATPSVFSDEEAEESDTEGSVAWTVHLLNNNLLASCCLADVDRVKAALDAGANPNITCPEGQSALQMAVYTTVAQAMPVGVEVVKLLLERGANPNFQSHGGHTALAIAARWNNQAVADVLLAHGADRSLANDLGATPAKVAEVCGHATMAKLLM